MSEPARKTSSPAPEKQPAGGSPKSSRFPPGIPFIVGNEGAERFSYYGMRAILWAYLTSLYLGFREGLDPVTTAAAEARGTQVAHLFMAAVYAFPMIGAILSDRLLGKYRVIFWVSLIYCAGHGVLAVAGHFATMGQQLGDPTYFKQAEIGMYIGLALIAIGSGGIKPCVSANVGDQFTAENAHLVTRVYQIFYFIINFGSFFSTLLIPILRRELGPEVAFGVPGILMGLATVVFWMGRNKFTKVPPNPGGKIGLLDFISSVLLFTPIAALMVGFFAGEGHFDAQAPVLSGAWFAAWAGHLASTFWPHLLVSIMGVLLGFVIAAQRNKERQDTGFISVTTYAIKHRKQRKAGEGFFDVAREKFGAEAAEGPPAVLRIMVVFSMVSVFWALFDQHASTWIKQAGMMGLELTVPKWLGYFGLYGTIAMAFYGGVWLFAWVGNRTLPKITTYVVLAAAGLLGVICLVSDIMGGQWTTVPLDKSQLSALNPLMVMLIIPGLNIVVYAPLSKRGIEVTPLQKMTAGMFLAAVAFASAAFLQMRVEATMVSGEKIHALWQIVQYFLMTTSEVLVSVTGLEFAYTQAPRAMKSTIMGFWLLCITAGNMLVAFLAPLQATLALSSFFWVFAVLMSGAALVFAFLASRYRGKTYLQERSAAVEPEPQGANA